jgi:hypothetical protein
MMKHLLAVVMDGLKDTDKMVGYAHKAMEHKADKSIINWFVTRAQNRLSMAERDWKDVDEELKKDKHDDELLDALECHVNHWMEDLRERVAKL